METHSALLFCRHFLCRLPNAGLWGLFFPGAWSSNSPLQIKSSMPALPYEHYGCVYCGGHDRFRRLKLRLKLFLCILFLCILGGCGVTSHQPLPSHWGQGWDKRLPMENWHLATRKPVFVVVVVFAFLGSHFHFYFMTHTIPLQPVTHPHYAH